MQFFFVFCFFDVCVGVGVFSPGGVLDSGGRVARKRVLQRSFEFSGEAG